MIRHDAASGAYRNLTSYGDPGFSRYLRRAFLASAGYDALDLERPVVGIVDTSSDFNPCHREMPQLVQAVKRGVLEAGGLPFAFPTASLHELLISPTAMLYRNLVAMETEEVIRAYPMDAVVLLGGCDKTVPAQLMVPPPLPERGYARLYARHVLQANLGADFDFMGPEEEES